MVFYTLPFELEAKHFGVAELLKCCNDSEGWIKAQKQTRRTKQSSINTFQATDGSLGEEEKKHGERMTEDERLPASLSSWTERNILHSQYMLAFQRHIGSKPPALHDRKGHHIVQWWPVYLRLRSHHLLCRWQGIVLLWWQVLLWCWSAADRW